MNNIPYTYDVFFRDYLIDYYIFSNYVLIKDLSVFNNDYKLICLIFQKDNKKYLFGFDDGIMFPLININLKNFNADNYKQKIIKIINDLKNKIKEYYDDEIKIYNNPYYQYYLGFDLFKYLGYNSEQYFDLINIIDSDNILNGIKTNVKNLINKYNKNKIYVNKKIDIFYGEISDTEYNKFIKKHFELAQRKTKSEKCWLIFKQAILDKKAFLVHYDNNYVYFFISNNISYYASNACDKKSDICIILIYEAIIFLESKKCNFIYMYHYENNTDNEKTKTLSFFKKSMSNKIINNYYCIL
jgi:hypothetical protein